MRLGMNAARNLAASLEVHLNADLIQSIPRPAKNYVAHSHHLSESELVRHISPHS